MADNHSVEEFLRLKKSISDLNAKLSVIEGQRKEKESQLQVFLTKHSVSSVEELSKKYQDLQKKADEYFLKAETYLNETSSKVSQIEKITAS